MSDDSRTFLSQAKGLGASSGGTTIWIAQRISAIALIPLVIWFVIFILEASEAQDLDQFSSIFTSPFPAVFLAIFLVVGSYHGGIGMIEIIEDYVHCPAAKVSLILFIKFLSFITAIAGACALLVLHLSTFVFN